VDICWRQGKSIAPLSGNAAPLRDEFAGYDGADEAFPPHMRTIGFISSTIIRFTGCRQVQ